MNHSRLPIVVLYIAIIVLFMYCIYCSVYQRDTFMNYPQLTDPTQSTTSAANTTNEASDANQQYAMLLLYLKKNPATSARFIDDIKHKFFNEECTVKSFIDFDHIAEIPTGMVF